MEGSGIYTITNLLTNKIYVGSSLNINYRIRRHKEHLKNNKHHNFYLQKDYNNYGLINFKFELLEFHNEEYLLDFEIYWMNLLNSLNRKYGYNIATAGRPPQRETIPIKQFDLEGNFIKEWKSAKEIERTLNIDSSSILKNCKGKINYMKNNIFRYKNDSLNKYNYKVKRGNKITQFTLDNKKVKIWNSITEASNFYKADASAISRCCRNISKSSLNFKWKYGSL